MVGHPVIVSTDPEFSHFVFLQDGITVEPWYLDTFTTLLGQSKLTSSSGALHKHVRNMIMDHFGAQKQKDALVFEMESIVHRHLDVWSKQQSVELKEVLTTVNSTQYLYHVFESNVFLIDYCIYLIQMSFEIGSKKLLSYNPSKHKENLKDKYANLLKGLVSFPLNIPGFMFHKCQKVIYIHAKLFLSKWFSHIGLISNEWCFRINGELYKY